MVWRAFSGRGASRFFAARPKEVISVLFLVDLFVARRLLRSRSLLLFLLISHYILCCAGSRGAPSHSVSSPVRRYIVQSIMEFVFGTGFHWRFGSGSDLEEQS